MSCVFNSFKFSSLVSKRFFQLVKGSPMLDLAKFRTHTSRHVKFSKKKKNAGQCATTSFQWRPRDTYTMNF